MISEKLKGWLVKFTFPHECAFERGHYGDMAHVVYEDVSGDGGGVTKWGIDHASHSGVDIKNLSMDEAIAIYQEKYWDRCRCEELAEPLCFVVFDIAVNNGVGRAILWLQAACGVDADGKIGPVTVGAANEDPRRVAVALITKRGEKYVEWAEEPKQHKFLDGWLERNKDLKAAIA